MRQLTRGERGNNPGNIRREKTHWEGEVPSNDPAFEKFDTPEHGIRALARTLLTYQKHHGLKTIRELISRWAPAVENNTTAYVDAVAEDVGCSADVPVLLDSPTILFDLVKAIIRHENGRVIYADAVIEDGLDMAYAA